MKSAKLEPVKIVVSPYCARPPASAVNPQGVAPAKRRVTALGRSDPLGLRSIKMARQGDPLWNTYGVSPSPLKGERTMTTFSGKTGVTTYQAVALKHGLLLYARTGIRPNRAWTPTAMLRTATSITGHAYKRGQHLQAAHDLEAWLLANGDTQDREA